MPACVFRFWTTVRSNRPELELSSASELRERLLGVNHIAASCAIVRRCNNVELLTDCITLCKRLETRSDRFGGLSPKDKDWNERARVGREALIKFEVLKP